MFNFVKYYYKYLRQDFTLQDVLEILNYIKGNIPKMIGMRVSTQEIVHYIDSRLERISIPENFKNIIKEVMLIINFTDMSKQITENALVKLQNKLNQVINDNGIMSFLQNRANLHRQDAVILRQNMDYLLKYKKINKPLFNDLIGVWNNQECNTKLFALIQEVTGITLITRCTQSRTSLNTQNNMTTYSMPAYTLKQKKVLLFRQLIKTLHQNHVCNQNLSIPVLDACIKLCDDIIALHKMQKQKGSASGGSGGQSIYLRKICTIMHQEHVTIRDIQIIRDAFIMLRNEYTSVASAQA